MPLRPACLPKLAQYDCSGNAALSLLLSLLLCLVLLAGVCDNSLDEFLSTLRWIVRAYNPGVSRSFLSGLTLVLTVFATVILPAHANDLAAASEAFWQPQKTRVFVVSMTEFKGGVAAPWGSKGRLDEPWLECLKEKGVPASQIEFLTDAGADSDSVRKHLDDFLARSKPDELLIFYFGSHGSYNAKTNTYSYVTYDGHLPFQFAFDSIEHNFKGSKVLMFSDCCYSGGIVEIVRERNTPIQYACLSSAYSHNVAYSGWRFLDCILRGFSGASVVDLNADGHIGLDELALFSEKHMAFVAEGKPMFATTNGFDPHMILSEVTTPKKNSQIGEYVEDFRSNSWHKSEITDTKPGFVRVHETNQGATFDDWLDKSQIRPFKYQEFAPGAHVMVKGSSSAQWYPATVQKGFESLYLCHYEGWSAAYDEYVGPSRIKAASATLTASMPTNNASNLAGMWKGTWENNCGQSGQDSLDLSEDANGNFEGLWSGEVKVQGRRLDANTAQLWANTPTRDYHLTAALSQGVVTLTYVAKRLDSSGTYEGKALLKQATR